MRSVEFAETRKGGYDPAQVDQFLERVAATVQELQGLLYQADERVRQYAAMAAQQQNVSEQMAEVLRMAQQRAEEMLQAADAQGRQLLAEAEARAARLDQEIAARRHALEGDIRALLSYEEEYRGRLRAALEAQIRLLDETRSQPPGPAPEFMTAPAAQVAPPMAAPAGVLPQGSTSVAPGAHTAPAAAPHTVPMSPAPAPQAPAHGHVLPMSPGPVQPGAPQAQADWSHTLSGAHGPSQAGPGPVALSTLVAPEVFEEQVHVVRQGLGLEDEVGGGAFDVAPAERSPQAHDRHVDSDAAAGLFRRLSHE